MVLFQLPQVFLYLTVMGVVLRIKKTDCSTVSLDCGTSEQSCPQNDNITLKCQISGNYLEWKLLDSTNNKIKEADFSLLSDINGSVDGPNDFKATLIANDSGFTSVIKIDLLQNEGTTVICNDFFNENTKQCKLSYSDPPGPPENVTYASQNTSVQLRWSQPNAEEISHYSVNITPSVNGLLAYNTSEMSLLVHGIQIGMEYTASVRAVLCNGNILGTISTVHFSLPSTSISQTGLLSSNLLSPVLSTTHSYQTSTVTFSTGPTVSTTKTIALSSTNVLSPVLSTTTSYQTSIVTFSTGPTVSTITTTKTIASSSVQSTLTTTENPITETNEDQSDIWTMLIVSGTVGGFITLLFLSIIVTSVVCLYHLKIKNKSSAKQVSQKQPLPFHHPPPPPLPSRVAIQLSNPFVVTTNSLYENTISIQSPDVVTYSVPIFNRTLKASENSKMFEV